MEEAATDAVSASPFGVATGGTADFGVCTDARSKDELGVRACIFEETELPVTSTNMVFGRGFCIPAVGRLCTGTVVTSAAGIVNEAVPLGVVGDLRIVLENKKVLS